MELGYLPNLIHILLNYIQAIAKSRMIFLHLLSSSIAKRKMQIADNAQKLVLIKILHTVIWVFFNVVLVYLFYAVFTSQIGWLFWLGIAAFAGEFIILLIYSWNCPLTFWARKYSSSEKDNFDIYLPNWVAKYNKAIYSILMITLIILFVYTQILL